ncbi:hypothetical protein [Winogradskyella sp. 4-2091]|uniref:hypothetical protein n=1 Tax=Winogradskyella sp. 4-2091 TaxID=3381659 RepID=UPI00389251EB
MKRILILFFALCIGHSYSQELNEFELESRNKADLVFDKIAEFQSENLPYLLFGIGNSSYLIIIDRNTHYTRIKANLIQNDSIEVESIKSLKKTIGILEKAFDISIYHKGFIGFQSEFYKNGYELANGAMSYFVMKDKDRNRYGESCLSVIVKPNPIDIEIYNYFVIGIINE